MEINDAFKGRVAVVTGASSGIGREVAGQLAAAGMKVGALARREERLQALASERDGILPVSCDVRDERSVKDAFARVGTELGPCAVVVNNAGLGRKRSLLDGDTDAWREMLEVNVLGLAACTREALAQMLPEAERGRWGYVIHISSMAGHRVPRGSGMYAATKHGRAGSHRGAQTGARRARRADPCERDQPRLSRDGVRRGLCRAGRRCRGGLRPVQGSRAHRRRPRRAQSPRPAPARRHPRRVDAPQRAAVVGSGSPADDWTAGLALLGCGPVRSSDHPLSIALTALSVLIKLLAIMRKLSIAGWPGRYGVGKSPTGPGEEVGRAWGRRARVRERSGLGS